MHQYTVQQSQTKRMELFIKSLSANLQTVFG